MMSATESRPEPPPGRDDRDGSWSGERDTILPEEQTPVPMTPPVPDEASDANDDQDTARPNPE
jgi:hypothetical protein